MQGFQRACIAARPRCLAALVPRLHCSHVISAIAPQIARCMSASPKKKARRQEAKLNGGAEGVKFRRITVALVGRPNVGKSSLFNRLAQQKVAIVHSTPGTTRDWKEATGRIGELEFVVMDTGGLEDKGSADAIERKMMSHTEVAIRHADVILFVVDGRAGVTEEDTKFARWVKQRRPQGGVHLIANKMEGWNGSAVADNTFEESIQSSYRLGLGDPIPLSAEHGDGLQDLYGVLEPYARVEKREVGEVGLAGEEISEEPQSEAQQVQSGAVETSDAPAALPSDVHLPSDPKKRKMVLQRLARQAGAVQIAIVGRPNVGKSTMINQLLGEERVLAGPTPGLTRDVTSVDFNVLGRALKLVDTAGMRRFGTWDLSTPLEGEAVGMAKRALERSHVVVLVIDGSGGMAGGLTSDKIRFADRELLQSGGIEADSLGTPSKADTKSNALARVAERVAGSPQSRAERGEVVAAASPARSSRSSLGRPFGLTKQDLVIIEQILEEGRALVVALNKLDASPAADDVARIVRGQLDGMHSSKGTEVVPLAALRGRGVEELLPAVLRAYDRWNMRVPTGRLNTWLNLTLRQHPAPTVQRLVGYKGRGHDRKAVTVPVQLKVKYVSQVAARPPTFTVWTNRPDVPDAYRRFLVNSLRDEFGLGGTPIRLHIKTADNPFTAKGRQARENDGGRRRALVRGGGGRDDADGQEASEESDGVAQSGRVGRVGRGASRGGSAGPGRKAGTGKSGVKNTPTTQGRMEKADGKRQAYQEARESAAESDSAEQPGGRGGGTPRRVRARIPASMERMARSAAMSGGRIAPLRKKEMRKMQRATDGAPSR